MKQNSLDPNREMYYSKLDRDSGKVVVFYNTGNPQHPFNEAPNSTFVAPVQGCLRAGPTVGDGNGDGISDLVISAE